MTNRKKQLKLAFLSPLPPARSGIADYSAMLLPALSQHYEVEVVVDAQVSDAWVNTHLVVRDVYWFEAHAGEYDRVIYHVGNSSFHYYIFDLIERFPGVVVLHDFFLGHAISGMDALGLRSGAWSQSLYESHGDDALYQWFKQLELEDLQWTYPANALILKQALGVIVHTQCSKKLADEWYGQNYAARWVVIPLVRTLPEPYDRSSLRRSHHLNQEDFLVCSFGMLGPTKLNDRLLTAWLDSALAANPNSRLIFVGEEDNGAFGQVLANRIAQSGCADRVQITGWVDEATYHDYLAMADVAVQLRSTSRGEMSAAVLDCMRYELPTIVNEQAGLSEIAIGAVYRVAADCPQAELVAALNLLGRTKNTCQVLATVAKLEIEHHHLPDDCALKYVEAIESFYGALSNQGYSAKSAENIKLPPLAQWAMIKQLRQVHHKSEADLYLRMTAHRQLIEGQLEEVGSQLTLAEKKQRIAEGKLRRSEEELRRSEEELRHSEEELRHLEEELRHSEEELSAILESNSWRLTGPIRCLLEGGRNATHLIQVKCNKVKARLKQRVKQILIIILTWLRLTALFMHIKHKIMYRFLLGAPLYFDPSLMPASSVLTNRASPHYPEAILSKFISRSEQVVYERLKLGIKDKKFENH